MTTRRAFALDASGLRVFQRDFSGGSVVRLPVDAASVTQLLAFRDSRILALRGDCIVSFAADGTAWQDELCGLSDSQLRETLQRARMCSDRALDERLEGEPLARIDVIVRRGGSRESENLTGARGSRFNTDPRFVPGCGRIVFVSHDDGP